MSSGTANEVGKVGQEIRAGVYSDPWGEGGQEVSGPSNFMSDRQQLLDVLWSHYRCKNYDGRKYNWHGKPNQGFVERAAIARGGEIPAGYYDASGETMPLEMRKPLSPYYLGKAIPDRFTAMLFSTKRHPEIQCDDADTKDWLDGFAASTRLWAKLIRARTFGGAMGSVGLGYKFQDGKPFVEVFDPRWATPEFEDKSELTVKRLEVLYQYHAEVRDEDGNWVPQWYWFRRVIDEVYDTTWPKVQVLGAEEPNWANERNISRAHGLPHCPVVWIQNMSVQDDIDGDPDCLGAYDLIESIDTLLSQANRGTTANCDPTVAISSDAEFESLKKGTGNALQVEKGGSIGYLEMSGAGTKQALEVAADFEEKVLTMTRCVLDRNTGGPSRTATEVEHNYSAMIDQADILREQYGESGVKRLLEMVLTAAKALSQPRIVRDDVTARIVKTTIKLPKKKVVDETTGAATFVERVLGNGEEVDLQWPAYFTPTVEAIAAKVEAAGRAKQYGILDTEHAMAFIATDFNITNTQALIAKIASEEKDEAKLGLLAPPKQGFFGK